MNEDYYDSFKVGGDDALGNQGTPTGPLLKNFQSSSSPNGVKKPSLKMKKPDMHDSVGENDL